MEPVAPRPRKLRKTEVEAGPVATPRARKPRKPVAAPPAVDRLVEAARRSLEDDKAEDIVVLDIADRSSFADRMIVASGLADRQIQAMAQHLEQALREAGLRQRVQVEGLGSSDWVLIDAGDLVIHLFKPEARAERALERMWGPDSPAGEVRLVGSDTE
ncbi:ribosome silencing factor [Roseomonas sp. NAR14]|uniref:Ribosomal silencing factor RsfS n=1 Tax=Roseomonas acroporae TaxID=2937791 RepID=A0A9X1Y9W8_9PROT|nr:ribosome silencing factor [Roseomonas acroporae]MCK8785827.1 ribosome silencing factor [Roseomonas acroporae]